MNTIDVIGTPTWGAGRPEKRGQIDDTGFVRSDGERIVLSGAACAQLLDMLGNGYMAKSFHLVRDGRLFKTCRIVRIAGEEIILEHEGEISAE